MEKKFITKEQKEKVSNRLVLNFGILLAGALIMLYVYNFVSAGYTSSVKNVLLTLGIIFAVLTVVTFVLGMKKFPSLKKYSPVALGAFIACGVVASTKFIPSFPIKTSVLVVFILMAVYFIVMAIYTGIYLKTHPVLIEKKNIHHKKKRK